LANHAYQLEDFTGEQPMPGMSTIFMLKSFRSFGISDLYSNYDYYKTLTSVKLYN
jgi:hypothetical protein